MNHGFDSNANTLCKISKIIGFVVFLLVNWLLHPISLLTEFLPSTHINFLNEQMNV